MLMKREFLFVFAILLLLAFSGSSASAISSDDCLLCHNDETLTKETETGVEISLFVDEEKYLESNHGVFDCTDCHADIEEVPHEEGLAPVSCVLCHTEAGELYDQSVHGNGFANGDMDVPTCQACHGSHYIKPVADPGSMVYPLSLPATCGKCHADEKLAERHDIPVPDAYQKYLTSVHGQGVLKSGLLVAATCTDCHGSHLILPEADPQSMVHRNNVPATCGACHAGIIKVYSESIHGALLLVGDEKVPVCTQCHSVHTIGRTGEDAFKLDIIAECGGCHEKLIETYRESYHGKVTDLGYTSVARCSDCHGFHDVRSMSDPNSRVSEANIIQTCQRCHPSANANFVKFLSHGDHRDRENYPALYYTWLFMTTLLTGVFTFFGIHLLLWFLRSLLHRIRHGKGETT